MFLHACYVPGSVLSFAHALFHLVLSPMKLVPLSITPKDEEAERYVVRNSSW